MSQATLGGWEHKGFYFAMETTWGTKIVAETASTWYLLRDEGKAITDANIPRDRPATGSGRPAPIVGDVVTGATGAAPVASTHPLTLKNSAWLFGSLANGNIINEGAAAAWARHDSPSPADFCTIMSMVKAGGKAYYGTSCNVSQCKVTFPAAEAGATSGRCTIEATWIPIIGEYEASQTVHATLAGQDDGTQLSTKDMSVRVDNVGTVPDGDDAKTGFISGSLTFTNGYTLHPPEGDGYASGATYGMVDVVGEIVALGGLTLDTTLRAAYENGTHKLVDFYFAAGNLYRIPCLVGRPTRSETAGATAWTYPLMYLEDDDQTEGDADGYGWVHINSSADGAPWDDDA